MATLADVARRAGVSPATVSRVINGGRRVVTDALRARVLEAVRELRFVPNAHARALVGATTPAVGVIVHDVSDPYFAEIMRGIQRVASEAGRLVTICNSYREPERELAYVALLRAQRVGALVLAGGGLDDREFAQEMAGQVAALAAEGGRAAFIGRHHVPGDAVIPDNSGGARALGRALVAMGHREFGVVSGPERLTTTRDRLEGFRSALAEAGIGLPSERVVPGGFTRDGGAEATRRLLERAPRVTAIFALNDPMAVGALAVLRARGLRVPGEVSVAGFDDIPITRDVEPALSTVRVPMTDLGARAMALALAPAGPDLRVEHVPTELVLRRSTAPAPRRR
jgi:LacI family transcriptional regulator